MRHVKTKQFVLLLGLMMATTGGNAIETNFVDGHSKITVMQGNVQGSPKGSTIQASINGHTLLVMFSENIGQVEVEITTTAGVTVDCLSTMTPTGFQCYIPNAGDYIVTFTLSNGDVYYGEFIVTD